MPTLSSCPAEPPPHLRDQFGAVPIDIVQDDRLPCISSHSAKSATGRTKYNPPPPKHETFMVVPLQLFRPSYIIAVFIRCLAVDICCLGAIGTSLYVPDSRHGPIRFPSLLAPDRDILRVPVLEACGLVEDIAVEPCSSGVLDEGASQLDKARRNVG